MHFCTIKKTCLFAAILASALFMAMLMSLTLPAFAVESEGNQTLDMYLIAGQSNAAGYTRTDSGGGVGEVQTYRNVLYTGQVDKFRSGTVPRQDLLDENVPVTAGLGMGSTYIGPEYGMAEVLSDYYTEENPALIFKSAYGGTSLRDVQTSNGAQYYGNWYPRSLWPAERSGATGLLYELFVNNFQAVYTRLVEEGYAPAVKAMIWMQGEDDRDHPEEYQALIKTFVADMRHDLGEIVNADLSGMPFIMGEISPTFYTYTDRTKNEAFNAALREVAADPAMVQVYTVNTEDLLVNTSDEDGTNVSIGSDAYHFNAPDMVKLGNRFAETAIEAAGKHYLTYTYTGSGSMTATEYLRDGEPITLTFRPTNRQYKLLSLIINGQDMTAQVSGNTYVIENPNTNYVIRAVFGAKTSYTIQYSADPSMGGYDAEMSSSVLYEGDRINVLPIPADGYEVDQVTFDGVALDYNSATGYWTSGPVYQGGTVTIAFRALEGQGAGDGAGCSGSAVPLACGGIAGCGLAGGAMLVLRKRPKQQ